MIHDMIMAAAGASGPAAPSDADFENTVLLLHGDGTNGAQNNTFLDSSTNNFTITRNGNTTQGSFSPFSKPDGRWGTYYDGTGDYLNVGTITALGSGDFTISAWVYPQKISAGVFHVGGLPSSVTGVAVFLSGTAAEGWGLYAKNSQAVSNTGAITLNKWYYITVIRSGTTTTLYVDGVSAVVISSDNTNYTQTSLAIGGFYSTSFLMLGYISNFRIVSSALTATVPTAPFTAVSGTTLLTCQSNRFVDNSSNNRAITRNGDVRVTPFSPFPITTAYDPAVNGGSGYFDGSGDYLSVGSASDWTFLSNTTAAYTIEMWIYPTTSVETVYFDTAAGTTANVGVVIYKNSSNAFVVESCFGSSGNRIVFGTSTGAVTLNAWNHVFISYDQSLANTNLVFYINGVAAGTANKTGNTPSNSNPANALSIATYGAGGGQFVSGYISSLRISNTVRSVPSGVPTAPYTSDANTKLLTNFTNAGIFDNTGFNNLETVGNAQIDTSVKKYGTGAMKFDGSGDWSQINSGSNDLFNFGTGNFTVECWFYRGSTSGRADLLGRYVSTPAGWGIATSLTNAGDIVFYYGNTTIASTAGSTWSANTWTHVAVVRSGTSLVIYVNGVSSATATNSTDMIAGNPLQIGAGGASSQALNGYIDDLRITKGIARYTANFTPPTAEFPNIGD